MRNILSLLVLLTISSLPTGRAIAQSPTPPEQQGQPPVLKGTKKSDKTAPDSKPDGAPRQEVGEDEVVRINTTLVTVPVTVLDADGNYVTDLEKGDFRVYEDGVEQEIAVFNQVDKPVYVVLLIDASGSVIGSLPEIKAAAIAFTDQLQPADYVFPVMFSGTVIPLLPQATNDRAALRKAIGRIEPIPDNATSLYDAVQIVNDRILKRLRGRTALILFTDGEDASSSKATKESTLDDAQESEALIYTIQYPRVVSLNKEGMVTVKALSPEHGDYLKRLAEATGGRFYKGDSGKKIKQSLASIAEELRRQYVLGYYPGRPIEKGQGRKLKVLVNRQNMNARTRKTIISNH